MDITTQHTTNALMAFKQPLRREFAVLAQLQDGSVEHHVLVHFPPNEEMHSFLRRLQSTFALPQVPRVLVAWERPDGSTMLPQELTFRNFEDSLWLLGKRFEQGDGNKLVVCPDPAQPLEENMPASPSELSTSMGPDHTQGPNSSQCHDGNASEFLPK